MRRIRRVTLACFSLATILEGHPADPIGQVEMKVVNLRRRSRAAIKRGWKVRICETIRKRSPHSGAKFDGNSVCHRNSNRRPILRARTGSRRSGD